MSDAARIKELLRERVTELAQYLFPNGHREGVNWCVGSMEGEPGKSFKICIAGPKAGLWGDFAGPGKHSRNLLDLWMHARSVDFKTALREAAEWLGQHLNRTKQSASTAKSIRRFPTLSGAIGFAVRTLRMLVKRRDVYHDRNGNEHFVVVRFGSNKRKEYRPFHRNGAGWVMSDPPGKLPLFGLPGLIRPNLLAGPNEQVFVVEGEKCVCELETIGLLVTTSAHGAESADKSDWQPLAGREVVILPDNDTRGRTYAWTVAAILNRLSPPSVVKIVELPGLPEKGDCVDWLDARDSQTPEDIRTELLSLVAKTEVFRKSTATLAETVEVQPFPLHCLSSTCEAMARAICETVRVLEPLTGSCVLGFLSAAIGAGLQAKSGANRVTRGNLYIFLSAESGSGKSETFRHLAKPFLEFEAKRIADWNRERKPELLAEQKILEAEIAKLTKKAGKANGTPDRNEIRAELEEKLAALDQIETKLREPVLSCEDVTGEKLAVLLAHNDEQLASLSADALAIVNILLSPVTVAKLIGNHASRS